MGQDYSYTQPSSSSEELDITSLIVAEGELYANEVESNFTISQEDQYAAAPEADEGIPRTCYCGSEPVVKTSYTPKNPYRRKSLGGFKHQCLNSSWASKVQQQDM
ncbi:hypothetical protein Bca52824_047775 [Brassica carinata]|uniref:Uncharacterized protein n=1 Tax=Brassica carinata TaxID=52824 RepID=A0A8X7UTM3_BRACI|nr:hypothetical protein Bca52824_047775 [Brassica carinata]